MNQTFRDYVFGRNFLLQLSEKQVNLLSALCAGDQLARYGLDGHAVNGLIRRGLVRFDTNDTGHRIYLPTKAGSLVYELLVEAGEMAALDEKRRACLEAEEKLHAIEWDERFGEVRVKLKDAYRRHPSSPPVPPGEGGDA